MTTLDGKSFGESLAFDTLPESSLGDDACTFCGAPGSKDRTKENVVNQWYLGLLEIRKIYRNKTCFKTLTSKFRYILYLNFDVNDG